MIAATRAVLVEVGGRDAVFNKPFSCWGRRLDRTRRRDVVGGDLVAEKRKNARALDIGDRVRRMRQTREIRRIAHVGRLIVPFVGFAFRRRNRLPMRIAGEDIRIGVAKQFARDVLAYETIDLGVGRPDVAQIDSGSRRVVANRFARQIDRHCAGERESDNERRRSEIIRLHVRIDATFKIAISRQHRRDD